MNKEAFSLVEVLVVISLVGILSALSLSFGSFYADHLIKIELQKFQNACIFLQQKAYATGTKQQLMIDIPKNRYTYNGTTSTLCTGLNFGFNPGVYGPPSAPRHAISHTVSTQKTEITFFPSGIMQATTIYFKKRDRRTMYAITIGIAQKSFVRKYIFDGTWKVLH